MAEAKKPQLRKTTAPDGTETVTVLEEGQQQAEKAAPKSSPTGDKS